VELYVIYKYNILSKKIIKNRIMKKQKYLFNKIFIESKWNYM